MRKVRLAFSKRGRACFIPHIALPSLFSRAASRAGIRFVRTEGFSPRPKISLGPELPVGVVALCEPMDVWLEEWEPGLFPLWRDTLPEGVSFSGWTEDPQETLGTACEAAFYMLRVRDKTTRRAISEGYPWPEWVREADCRDEWFRIVAERPGEHGPGVLVRGLLEFGGLQSWADVNVVRLVVGRLSPVEGLTADERVLPLVRCDAGENHGQ